jgi:hypothetical protein
MKVMTTRIREIREKEKITHGPRVKLGDENLVAMDGPTAINSTRIQLEFRTAFSIDETE